MSKSFSREGTILGRGEGDLTQLNLKSTKFGRGQVERVGRFGDFLPHFPHLSQCLASQIVSFVQNKIYSNPSKVLSGYQQRWNKAKHLNGGLNAQLFL